MKLKKAIEVHSKREEEGSVDEEEFNKAEQILFEAGKREQRRRNYDYIYPFELLPGETED